MPVVIFINICVCVHVHVHMREKERVTKKRQREQMEVLSASVGDPLKSQPKFLTVNKITETKPLTTLEDISVHISEKAPPPLAEFIHGQQPSLFSLTTPAR